MFDILCVSISYFQLERVDAFLRDTREVEDRTIVEVINFFVLCSLVLVVLVLGVNLRWSIQCDDHDVFVVILFEGTGKLTFIIDCQIGDKMEM